MTETPVNDAGSAPATDAPRPDEELVAQLVEQARSEGVDLVGPDGLLAGLTKRVLETGLEVEMSQHLGYDKHAREGRNSGNSRNGTRSKTVLTEVGPVQLDVPRDRDGTFDPQTVRKRQRRLHGVDEMVISLCAKGLTTGEISAHLAEVYGAAVSKETIWKDHRRRAGRHGRVAQPSAGPGLRRGVHRRDRGQDPRRASDQPARVHGHRGHRRRAPRRARVVDRQRR